MIGKVKDRTYRNLGMALDIAVLWMAQFMAWELGQGRSPFSFAIVTRMNLTVWQFCSLLMLAIMCLTAFNSMRLYSFRVDRPPVNWFFRFLLASHVATGLVVIGVVYISGVPLETRVGVHLWLGMVLVFTTYRMVLLQAVFIARRLGRNLRLVVIVGIGPRSLKLWEKLKKVEYGYYLLGFVGETSRLDIVEESNEFPYLCELEDLRSYISTHPVDEVWIALPMRSFYGNILEVIQESTEQGIKTRLLSDLFDFPDRVEMNAGQVSDINFLDYDTNPRSDLQLQAKRVMDIICSFLGFIVLSPVFLGIALAILLTDGWPIFFIQDRVGLNKRLFRHYKFRTMVKDAQKLQAQLEELNEVDGAAFKIANDPRVTRLGRFLRKSSLDELPQLINIFKGDMSLVGPRPLPLRDFERFYSDSHRLRFSVKPGLTGLWQISGRSDTDFEEWMKLDIFYVRNWSLFMDMRIVMQTVWIVLTMKGAY